MDSRILLVDAEGLRSRRQRRRLEKCGLVVSVVSSVRAALAELERGDVSVVVVACAEDAECLRACRCLCEFGRASVISAGDPTMAAAILALQAGVADYVVDPENEQSLVDAVLRVLDKQALLAKLEKLQSTEQPESTQVRVRQTALLGESPLMLQLRKTLERLADTDLTVHINGESGSGKELVARALHLGSSRRTQPFVALNCAALPSQLVESELFGYRRGAFTGANQDHPGLFAQANGGTLFLDELANMPLGVQAKLLRVLQERTVRPLGGAREVPFDVRLISASNVDLTERVACGAFREDLFFRLNVVTIDVPALRDRGDDVLLLAQHFLRQTASKMDKPVLGMTPGAAQALLRYDWPGNVRELANCIRAGVLNAQYDHLIQEDLPLGSEGGAEHDAANSLEPLKSVEERYINEVLSTVGGNMSHAARLLGLDRKTVRRKLKQLKMRGVDEAPRSGRHRRPSYV